MPDPTDPEPPALDDVPAAEADALDALEGLATDFATGTSPLLERLGLGYFRRRSARLGETPADAAIHILDAEERHRLLTIERRTVFRAGLAGALSALFAAGAELWADPLQADAPVTYWSIVLGVTALATALEIGFLYWDALRGVHGMARAAGVPLFGAGVEADGGGVALALVRAALELPNPPGNRFGINPLREVSAWRLAMATLLYKLKVTVTSFLLKALIRRGLGRVVVRAWLVLVSVPVTAAWNAVVAWRVIREARVRAMGPSAAAAVVADLGALPPRVALAARRAVAGAMVRSVDLHPNLVALLAALPEASVPPGAPPLDEPAALLDALAELEPEGQAAALKVLAVAAIIDGSVSRGERALYAAAQARCGLTPARGALLGLRRAFIRGRALGSGALHRAIGARAP